MILGIGVDLIEIYRIQKTYDRFKDRFIKRCFTAQEWHLAQSRQHVSATLAKRFAAKEACAKALGTGISQGITWKQIEVIKLPSGAVSLTLSGRALEKLNALMPSGTSPKIHLSLADNVTTAFAQVIISGDTQ